jgi:putative transposase
MARACRTWDLPRSTLYFQRQRRTIPIEQRPRPKRRGPLGPCPDEDLVGHIRCILTESPFHGEGYRKVWARLRYQGLRASKERVRRLMREHGLQAPQRVGHPHGPKAHDGTIITESPDEMWGTDMTTTVTTGEGQVCVFVAVDHCTSECIGIHASKSGNRFEALEPLRQGVREHFGGFEREVAMGLAIRHDHGSAYMSDDFQQELIFLGMASSPSFVREPEGNGVAERFIRTLKQGFRR